MAARKMTKKEYREALLHSWDFVRSERTKLGLSIVDLAGQAGLARSTVRTYFNTPDRQPRLHQLEAMVEVILAHKGELDDA